MIVDGANSFAFEALHLGLYQPSNPARLATGMLAGVCLAFVLAGHCQPLETGVLSLTMPFALVAASLLAVPNLAPGVLGTAGILSLFASANILAKPSVQRHVAWALALPELAALAAAKYALLAALR